VAVYMSRWYILDAVTHFSTYWAQRSVTLLVQSLLLQVTMHNTHTHIHFMALWTLSGITRESRYQKRKTNLDLLHQETVSGSGISWAIS